MAGRSNEATVTRSDDSDRRIAWWASGLVSCAIHAAVIAVTAVTLRGCQTAPPAVAGGLDFREIGLAVVPDDSLTPADDPTVSPQDSTAETPSEDQTDAIDEADVLPTEQPDLSSVLPPADRPPTQTPSEASPFPELVGTGASSESLPAAAASLPDLMRPPARTGAGAGGSLTPGPNSTSFMNIVSEGQSFVYVIDVSSSMDSGERLNLAKSQLKGSLRLLTPQQRFQILFYNEWVTTMKLRHPPEQNMYRATELSLLLAEREIDRVRPEGGTSHFKPLLEAVEIQPDVIYFLTDGDQPRPTATEMKRVEAANRNGASIHVVEFGSGARESNEVSWLQLLAARSGGKYSYIPVR